MATARFVNSRGLLANNRVWIVIESLSKLQIAMLFSRLSFIKIKFLLASLLAIATVFQLSGQAFADYVPQGGDPPPGRSSTSG